MPCLGLATSELQFPLAPLRKSLDGSKSTRMRRLPRTFRVLVLSLSCLISLSPRSLSQIPPSDVGVLEHVAIPAPSLAGNIMGDPTSQKALLYLPSGYKEHSSRRYPVLYLLHGFSLAPVLDDWGEVISSAMNRFVLLDPARAFIVVIPNGANAVFGSFYLNSSVGGNWEQYITEDVVHYIDHHYRTLTDRRSRAVAGHSMGRFAALRLAMLHSELFSTAYAMSPCCLDLQDDFTNSNPAWRDVVKLKTITDIRDAAARDHFWTTALAAFAVAASPNSACTLKADLPYRLEGNTLVPRADVIQRWKAVMPLNLINDHQSELRSLSGLAIDFGYEDDFAHIPDTSKQFARALLSLKIPLVIEGYHGDHNDHVPARVGTRMVPYIADHLLFAP
jgi:S-formylglutathione hydrolase